MKEALSPNHLLTTGHPPIMILHHLLHLHLIMHQFPHLPDQILLIIVTVEFHEVAVVVEGLTLPIPVAVGINLILLLFAKTVHLVQLHHHLIMEEFHLLHHQIMEMTEAHHIITHLHHQIMEFQKFHHLVLNHPMADHQDLTITDLHLQIMATMEELTNQTIILQTSQGTDITINNYYSSYVLTKYLLTCYF